MSLPLRAHQENLRPSINRPTLPFGGYSSPSEKLRIHDQSFSPSSHQSPMSGLDRDREILICSQIRKLGEMRKAQVEFFDMKMLEIKEAETRINERMDVLVKQDLEITRREEAVNANIRRVEMERREVNAIKELLRLENESIQVSSAELKVQLKRYEKIFKLQGSSGPPKIRFDNPETK